MPRWAADDVDVACESWAFQWVRHFGRDPDRASQYIGPLNCTLGRVHELHDGAASISARDCQRFPEVFLGTALAVNMAMQAMSLDNRRVAFAHYIGRWYDPVTWQRWPRPVKQSNVAADLGICPAEYYRRRDTAKQCVAVVLSLGVPEKPLAPRADRPLPSAGLGCSA